MQSPPTINVSSAIGAKEDSLELPGLNKLSRSLSDIYGSLSAATPNGTADGTEAIHGEIQAAIANQRLEASRRKYFDSGDYAMLKAKGGATLPAPIVHARPETIPQKSPFGSLGKCCKSSPVRDGVVSADDLTASGHFEALSLADSGHLDASWTVTNNNQD